ncbi:MAG: hypothetical protein NT013_19790 [Planctomycetia bacterium]|nr:hypothetical protein [Planctomycetia bacterium]
MACDASPASDNRPFKELPILEDKDARKVILLSPRGGLKLGLGCAVSLFIPAGVLCLPLVVPNGRVHEPWLWGGFLLLAIVGPVWVIWRSRTLLDTEHLLILEHDRITLRTRSFHQTTHELVDVNDETVGIGPGSGLTTDESVLKESSNSTTIVIWGPSGSLLLLAESDEFPWLQKQIHEWLRRQTMTRAEQIDRRELDANRLRSADIVEIEQRRVPLSESPSGLKKTGIRQSPPEGLISISEDGETELLIHIAAGGPAVVSFGWNSMGMSLFMIAFSLFWFFVVPDMGWGPFVICGACWLLTVVVLCVWIRRLFETVDIELSQGCLTTVSAYQSC